MKTLICKHKTSSNTTTYAKLGSLQKFSYRKAQLSPSQGKGEFCEFYYTILV